MISASFSGYSFYGFKMFYNPRFSVKESKVELLLLLSRPKCEIVCAQTLMVFWIGRGISHMVNVMMKLNFWVKQ